MKKYYFILFLTIFILTNIFNCKAEKNKNQETTLWFLALIQSQETQESKDNSESNSSSVCVYRYTQYYNCLENFTGQASSTFDADYFCDSYKQLDAETEVTETSCSALGFTSDMKQPDGNFYDTYSCRFAGNVSSYEVSCNTEVYNIFPADTISPSVSSTDPSNGATGVSTSPYIIINFSEGMDSDTISTSTVKLYQGSTEITDTTVFSSINPRFIFLPPSSGLSSGTEYTVTISTGVKDYYENSMTSEYSFSFTTE